MKGKCSLPFAKDLFGALISCCGFLLCIEGFLWMHTASALHQSAIDWVLIVFVFPELALTALVFMGLTVMGLFFAFRHLKYGAGETL